MSFPTHIGNKKKDLLVSGIGPTQGLEHTLTVEKVHSISKKKFCFSLHYNGTNSYLFVIGTEIYKSKTRDCEIVASPLCLGNIWKDWSTDDMKKIGLNGYVYDFSDDYDATDVDNINDIHKWFIKKNDIV